MFFFLLTNAAIAYLEPLAPTLTHLSIQSCVRVGAAGAASVASLANLAHLNLRACQQIYDDGISMLSTLTSLQQLNIQACSGIRGPGLAALGPCTALTSLVAKECGLTSLQELITLQVNILYGLWHVQQQHLVHLLKAVLIIGILVVCTHHACMPLDT